MVGEPIMRGDTFTAFSLLAGLLFVLYLRDKAAIATGQTPPNPLIP